MRSIKGLYPALPVWLFFVFAYMVSPAQANNAPLFQDGRKLAQAVYDNPAGKDVSSKVIMQLVSGNSTRERLLYSYAKDAGDGERWTLLRFIKPNDVERTGLLTVDYKGDDSDQWLYLPALDRVRRIAASRKGGRFVGSDFYYEDLTSREVSMDHHAIIGEDKIGGASCILLESIPVSKKNSVYSKRVSCIHPKILVPLRIDYYENGRDKPSKRLQARKIKRIQGYWTIFDSTMYNLKTGNSTKLITVDIRYDQGIPDNLFSQRGLSDDSRETPYRPDKASTKGKPDETH
ncbi:MAG: outer membrane lipoprotein-sorting protein [Porticoccaceae bacterium]